MDEIEFEAQYADELQALEDIEDFEPPVKPRRSLLFETPKGKPSLEKDDFSNSPLTLGGSDVLNTSYKKRGREKGSQSDSDLEYDDEDLNCTAPATKRPKTGVNGHLEEEDLWDERLPTPKTYMKSLHEKQTTKVIVEEHLVKDVPMSPDKRLMDKIVELRNKQCGRELKLGTEVSDEHITDYDFERQRVYRRIPTSLYIPTTGTGGDRVYMKLQDDSVQEQQFAKMSKTGSGRCLLTTPISVLREQLEEERRTELLQEASRLSENINRQLEEDQGFQDDLEDEEEDKENRLLPVIDTSGRQEKLWVEKYTPQRYTDLLSEENINRSLLHWLKMWDYVVFNKELPVKPKDKKDKKKEEMKKKKKTQFEVQDELDQHHRPIQKVALLCGPPGLGKTTLAHIIAKHAGYNVVEMNASDDRSVEVFKTKIENSTQMKAVLGPDPRPNCLIIDEIDGAPQASINVLLNVIKKTDSEEGGKKKKKEEGGVLRRPIICICNDQYVPALRQLRQIAMVMNFPQTDPTKLAGRLYEIVRFEKLRSDMNTLLALCEKTDNDIRSCLNTLQFIKGRCKELNMNNVQTMAVGQKDTHKSLFSVWYDVLTLPKPKRHHFASLQELGTKDLVINTTVSARFSNVMSLVQAAGETEKLVQGLFENYLDCKFKDPYMDGVSMATEWLCFNDEITQYIQHMQDYRLMPYLPYLSVTFHLLFAANVPPKIQFPHSMTDCSQQRIKCENLVLCMMADMTPAVRKFINLEAVTSDILPCLMHIIQPTFRPVNTQLYSTKEKEDLRHLVDIMISYNMTYQQEKTPEGQYNYVLEPHVDEVVKFTGMKQHKQLSYASKQLVAREIELEKMRKSEAARGPVTAEGAGSAPGKHSDASKTPAIPSHLQKLTAKPLGKQEEPQVKDFFGRVIKRTTPESKASNNNCDVPSKTNVLATDIWFHFQGGYSNAVRRNVRVKEFL